MASVSASTAFISKGSIIATLEGNGWSTTQVMAAISLINESPELITEINDLSPKNKISLISFGNSGSAATTIRGHDGFSDSSFVDIQTTTAAIISGTPLNNVENFVDGLAYELGHAEDPQNNNIFYGINDLQVGANVALDLSSEGKAILNQQIAVEEISKANTANKIVDYFPTVAGSNTQKILGNAKTAAVATVVGENEGQQGFAYYFDTEYIYSLPYLKAHAPSTLTNDLTAVSMSTDISVIFSQNADNTDGMTVALAGNSLTSYIVNFGSYGSIAPAGIDGGQGVANTISPSPSTATTYQEFTFTDGHEDWFIDSAAGGTIQVAGDSSGEMVTYISTLETGGLFSFGYQGPQLINGATRGTFALPQSTSSSDYLLTAYTSINSSIQITASNQLLFATADDANFTFSGSSFLTNVTLIDATESGGTLDITGTNVDHVYINETINSYGATEDLIIIASGFDLTTLTTSNIVEINASVSPIILNLSDNSGEFGQYSGEDPPTGFILNSDNGIGRDNGEGAVRGLSLVGFQDIVLGSGNDGVDFSSVAGGLTFAPGAVNGFITGSADLTDVIDLSGDISTSPTLFSSAVEATSIGTTTAGVSFEDLSSPAPGNATSGEFDIYNIESIVGGNGLDTFVLPDAGSKGGLGYNYLVGGTIHLDNSGNDPQSAAVSGITTIIVTDATTGPGNSTVTSVNTIVLVGFTTVETAEIYAQSVPPGSTANSGMTLTPTPGTVASNNNINSGGAQVTGSGGVASSTVVNSGGSDYTQSGGNSFSPVINKGGNEYVGSGGTVVSAIVDGKLYVSSGGTAVATTVEGGGQVLVLSGGYVSGTIIQSGGTETVYAGGSGSDIQVYSGGVNFVDGGTVSGDDVFPAGAEYVASGGLAIGSTIANAMQIVSAGGVASGTSVEYAGNLYVSSGGITRGADISYAVSFDTSVVTGSEEVVSYGGVASGTTVAGAYNELLVYSGGITSLSNIDGAGTEVVNGGGHAISTMLAGGVQEVLGGAVATGTIIDSGSVEYVSSGGTTSGSMILSGGTEAITAGGVVISATVEAGGTLSVSAGVTVSGTIVDSGGTQTVYSGGAVSGGIVSSGGVVYVSGGRVSAVNVLSGGVVDVYAGGTASGSIIKGGSVVVSSGGVASATAVSSGGTETVMVGGTASGSVDNAQGTERIYGSAAGLKIGSVGLAIVYAGGTASGTVISSGGVEVVSSGGTATNTTVLSGGELIVLPGATSGTVTLSGGAVVATGVAIIQAGQTGIFSSTISGGSLGAGATEYVYSSDLVSGSTLSGGVQNIYQGGTARSITVSGGVQNVYSGGVASSTVLSSGGTEAVYGSAVATTAGSGANITVMSGGLTSGSVIASGGVEFVSSGGNASAVTVSAGGLVIVMSGGSASGTVMSGGVIASAC